MKALRIERDLKRFAAARVAGALTPGRGAKRGPLQLVDVDPPRAPGPDWVTLKPRLSGICGSDLATVDGVASRYFEPIVSFPFVPGHELVADAPVLGGGAGTRRVVLEPVLGCVARNLSPVCPSCARGDLGNCERLAFGDLEPGLQTGFCCSTGGGWSTRLVAHPSQLHDVPEAFSDEAAVMVEPTACAVHGALRVPPAEGDVVVVTGAGTLGLLTIAALRAFTPCGPILTGAKYDVQKRWARELGADHVVAPDELPRLVRRLTGSMAYASGDRPSQLTGGADVVIDCVGSSESIQQALAIVKPRGSVVLVGMPAAVKLELTTLWHRETRLVGAYAYGTETVPEGSPDGTGGTQRRTFDLAMQLVGSARLERLVSATYRLDDYVKAMEHAASAGRRGAVKIAFDLRGEKDRDR